MTVRLVALHGFLGRPADWGGLAEALADRGDRHGEGGGIELHALDLWRILGDADANDWASAASALDGALAGRCGRGSAPAVFVVGYSLGARLALGSRLLSSPGSAVRGCCLVSCNPGLADEDAAGRRARRESDAAWAGRILAEPEGALWQAWDAQPVFAGSAAFDDRRDLPAPRDVLAGVLAACSLAGQPDLRPRLRAWPTPVQWVSGARDPKFVALSRELQQAGMPAEFVTCDDAGHRVPWDNPPAFAAALRGWIARVMENER